MEELLLDCNGLSRSDGYEAYRDLYRIGTTVDLVDGNFSAAVVGRRYPNLLLYDRTLSGLAHERTRKRVLSDGFDHATVQLVLSGRLGVTVGEARRWVRPGEMVAFDMRRPQRTWTDGAHFITVSIAREMLETTLSAAAQFHGRVFDEGAAPMVCDTIRALAGHGAADPAAAGAVTASLATIIGAMLGAGATRSRATASAEFKTARAMRFIRRNVGHADLSAAMIADRVGVSRSVLYRLFEAQGGVARTIKHQRLLALRKALTRRSDARPITTLAWHCGFASDAHASRSFRQRFGMTPGEYRASCRVGDANAERSERFAHWYDDFY